MTPKPFSRGDCRLEWIRDHGSKLLTATHLPTGIVLTLDCAARAVGATREDALIELEKLAERAGIPRRRVQFIGPKVYL